MIIILLVSLLQARTYSIRTLKDLLKSPLKIGVDDIVYNHYYFSVKIQLCNYLVLTIIVKQIIFVDCN